MSYSFEGKIVNQCPKVKNLNKAFTVCERCNKLVAFPQKEFTPIDGKTMFTYHYIMRGPFIYETKGKYSVVYCSKYCRNKHNHRFRKN